MEEWIQKHDGKEKEEYLKLFKWHQDNPEGDYVVKQENIAKPNRKRRFCETKNRVEYVDVASSDSIVQENFGEESNLRDDSEFVEVPSKKQKLLASEEFSKIIEETCFKIVNVKSGNGFYRTLLIFTSAAKSHCYEYKFNLKEKYFYHRCTKNITFKAILDQNENGNECIKTEENSHVCTPIFYDSLKYLEMKIIKEPDYEIFENCAKKYKRLLIVFDPDDRSKCYEYFWTSQNKFECCGCAMKKKQITAEICHENTKNEYIRLLNDQHVCEMRKYNPAKSQEPNHFILSPNFEIQTQIKDGTERKKLIIFDSNDRQLCYSYYFDNQTKKFRCNDCLRKQKAVSAKISQNSEGEVYVVLSNEKHVCSLRTYVPNQKEIILRPPTFKFVELKEFQKSRLFVFVSNNPKLCYTFSERSNGYFYCLGCAKLKRNENDKILTVKLCKENKEDEANDEYYVKIMNGQRHLCKPQKYEPEKYETKMLKPKNDYIVFRQKEKESISLAIYHSVDKKLCYKFYFDKAKNIFLCLPCKEKRSYMAATIRRDSNGNEYILMKQKKHVCTPIKCSSIIKSDTVILEKSGLFLEESKKKTEIDESRIVRLPNFELRRNAKGVPDKHIIVFNGEDRETCYYYRCRNITHFACNKCGVTAKINVDEETGEKYVILSENQHKCEPMEYESEKEIVEAPNFMVFLKNDINNLTKLVIFSSPSKEFCYDYTYYHHSKTFRCCACFTLKKKHVTAKLLTDENGQEYIKLLKNEHVCTPKKFILEEFQPKIIPESDFKLLPNKNGKPNSRLVIFDPAKDGYGYDFRLGESNLFLCNQCDTKKKHRLTVKLGEKENGEKYVRLSQLEHICKSRKYDPENDAKNDNFVVQHNDSGVPDSRITIFEDENKIRGYQYSFQKARNAYFCLECNNKRKFTRVDLTSNKEGKQSIKLSNQEHFCTIQNLKVKKLIFNNFKFEENGKCIISNHPADESRYYKFKYDEKLNAFCCIKCKEKKKFVTATVCNGKDNDEFLLLNYTHSCVPFLQ